jgi:hypothetical protein
MPAPSFWNALTKWRWSAPLAITAGALLGVISAVLLIPDRIDGAAPATRAGEPDHAPPAAAEERRLVPLPEPHATPPAPLAAAEPTPSPGADPHDAPTPPAYVLPPPPPPPEPAARAPELAPEDSSRPFVGVTPRSIRLTDATRNPTPPAP